MLIPDFALITRAFGKGEFLRGMIDDPLSDLSPHSLVLNPLWTDNVRDGGSTHLICLIPDLKMKSLAAP